MVEADRDGASGEVEDRGGNGMKRRSEVSGMVSGIVPSNYEKL